MWLSVLAVIAGALVGLASGGRLRRAARYEVRGVWWLVVGAVLEAAAGWWSLGGLGAAGLVAGYVALLTFAAANRRLPGLAIAAAGLAANLLVILVDGGMPVRRQSVIDAGMAATSFGPRHHAQGPGDHLTWLDDRLAVPFLHTVASIGDVFLAVGVAVTVARMTQYRGRYQRPGRLAALVSGRLGAR